MIALFGKTESDPHTTITSVILRDGSPFGNNRDKEIESVYVKIVKASFVRPISQAVDLEIKERINLHLQGIF